MSDHAGDLPGQRRGERLAAARLCFVVEAVPGGRHARELVSPALAGGVDVVELREKSADDEGIVTTGLALRRLCDEYRALLVVNDRPELALACDADGVHLGQDDVAVEQARAMLGRDMLIGLSTHSPDQIAAGRESTADYLGVGPVYATPTKPGAEPVGEALVRHAAEHARKPFFAIGGIDRGNARVVAAAGAERVAVVRAIRDAPDPRAAARALRRALDVEVPSGTGR